jgi:RecA-family ATPase
MQLIIAMTCDGRWLGRKVKQGRVMYFPVEDNANEMRRREAKITEYLDNSDMYYPVPKSLKIVPFLRKQTEGKPAPVQTVLAAYDSKSGMVQPTKLFFDVVKMIEEFRPDLVVLGNRVDIFSVNQNEDAHAKQCIQLLTWICEQYGTTIIMPGHVTLLTRIPRPNCDAILPLLLTPPANVVVLRISMPLACAEMVPRLMMALAELVLPNTTALLTSMPF